MANPRTEPAARSKLSWLLPSVRGYRRSWIRGDVIGGLAAGTVVIPQAMAYATIAGLPVEIGLYTCMLPMVIYGLLGGARALSVSTTSTIAVLVATTLAGLPGDRSDDQQLRAAFTLTFLVGICLLLMRLLRLGSLIEMISPATLTGIRVGVGLTVAASQLPALLGIPASAEDAGFFTKIADVVRNLPEADLATVLVGLGGMAVLLLLQRFAPRVPGPLVVVAAGILLVATTSIADRSDGHGVAVIDKVPTGLPLPVLPVPADMIDLLPGAMAIAVMAFMETVLVARTNRRRTEPSINVDQELVATGVAAIGGGFTQTMPPAGGFSQSAVNLRSGARSQLAGLVTAVLAILVAIFLAPLLDDLPRTILAAMVMVAILGLLNPKDFLHYARIDRAELWVAIVVAVIGLTGGMLLGVAVGVILTLALVVRNVNRPRVRPVFRTPTGGWTIVDPLGRGATDQDQQGEDQQDQDQQDQDQQAGVIGDVLLLHLDGALYAGNAEPTAEAVLRLVGQTPGLRAVVLEGVAVREVTVPMLDTFRDLSHDLDQKEIRLIFAAFPPSTLDRMSHSHWFAEQQKQGSVAETVDQALVLADQSGQPATEEE